jgi:hypothetical protein
MMDRTVGQWIFAKGNEVFGSEGDTLGKVVEVQPTYIVVEKGFFFPMDYFIPMNAIASFDGEHVHLNVTKDEALESDWGTLPTLDNSASDIDLDASGNAQYADAMRHLNSTDPDASADLATTGHMGESETSPGLAVNVSV